jgi:tetratricopeptide (TPR) repeat protein
MSANILLKIFSLGLIVLMTSCDSHTQKQSDIDLSNRTHQTDEQVYYNQGIIFSKQGKTKEAIAEWEKMIEINPNHVKTHYNLGIAYRHSGQIDKAIGAWKKAISLEPNGSKAYNNLGAAYLSQGKLDDAEATLNKAIAIEENYAKAHYNLARLYAQKNQNQQSLKYLQKAMTLDAVVLEEAKSNRDFSDIRQSSEFQELIRSFESN